ncbi:hypothetical protein QQ045_006016 [Rhodiola kirilowii]
MAATNMTQMGEMWTQMGSLLAGLMFIYAMFQQYVPYSLRGFIERRSHKLVGYVYPYIQITFHEYTGERMRRSEAYSAIENYLSVNSSGRAKRLKAETIKDSKSLVLSMDDHEEVTDDFQGAKLWWAASKKSPKPQSFSWYPEADEKRYYKLTFHRRHRDLITSIYLTHVLSEGNAISVKNRQRKLYTNSSGGDHGWKKTLWSHVVFEHPASFDTLAMEAKKKQDIINDLITFSNAKDYYAKIGKAWKRGYLLYGPPGTGKSTMIAAMANLLGYDVYDLELTAVKDNSQLRNLLIGVSTKSIIVIEDIDCSLELTGQRKKKDKDKDEEKTDPEKGKDAITKMKEAEESKSSKVTLSGLLNFIDGLWSACGGERIIVFTTNYLEKLDPALIRRGRMDMHIELSYCRFEAFKVLAKNYWDIEEHELFGEVGRLLEEVEMTPADVAENLMPRYGEDVESNLSNLIEALKKAKEDSRIKAEKEEAEKLKVEKECKDEQEKENCDKGKEDGGEMSKENGAVENGN